MGIVVFRASHHMQSSILARHRSLVFRPFSRIPSVDFFSRNKQRTPCFHYFKRIFRTTFFCRLSSLSMNTAVTIQGYVSVYIITQAALLSNYTPLYNVRTNVVIMRNVLTVSPRYFSRRCVCLLLFHPVLGSSLLSLANEDLMDESWIWVGKRQSTWPETAPGHEYCLCLPLRMINHHHQSLQKNIFTLFHVSRSQLSKWSRIR